MDLNLGKSSVPASGDEPYAARIAPPSPLVVSPSCERRRRLREHARPACMRVAVIVGMKGFVQARALQHVVAAKRRLCSPFWLVSSDGRPFAVRSAGPPCGCALLWIGPRRTVTSHHVTDWTADSVRRVFGTQGKASGWRVASFFLSRDAVTVPGKELRATGNGMPLIGRWRGLTEVSKTNKQKSGFFAALCRRLHTLSLYFHARAPGTGAPTRRLSEERKKKSPFRCISDSVLWCLFFFS